jgi:hypothetical protein
MYLAWKMFLGIFCISVFLVTSQMKKMEFNFGFIAMIVDYFKIHIMRYVKYTCICLPTYNLIEISLLIRRNWWKLN